jgi:hypothetical protein
MLAEEVKENEATRLEIIKKYADLDEKGEPKLTEKEDGSKHFEIPDEKLTEFQDEFTKFLETKAEFGGVGLKTRLETVKNIVLNTTEKIDPAVAYDYDAWCTSFEEMKSEE